MLRETSMKENGLMTRPMASECTLTLMEVDTRANGIKINSMALV